MELPTAVQRASTTQPRTVGRRRRNCLRLVSRYLPARSLSTGSCVWRCWAAQLLTTWPISHSTYRTQNRRRTRWSRRRLHFTIGCAAINGYFLLSEGAVNREHTRGAGGKEKAYRQDRLF